MSPAAGERDAGVVLAAAGGGARFGGRKQFLELGGRLLLHRCLDAFAAVEAVVEVVLVCPAPDHERARGILDAWSRPGGGQPPRRTAVAGGARRQDSVLRGLQALSADIPWALVHDAARPLVQAADIRRLLDAMHAHGAAVVGTPCHDSVKRVKGACIVEELARESVWTVQTPQGARLELLREAYERQTHREWTDEASALRHAGHEVVVVEGSRENMRKITTPGDEILAARILAARAD